MRLLSIPVVLLSFVALILGFLSLFAGNKPSFMQGYYMVSLNTSQIGSNLVAADGGVGGVLGDIIGGITGDAGDIINDLAHAVGVKDYYSLHVLDYCEGYFTPMAVPNATVHNIKRQGTYCSPHAKKYTPGEALTRDLNLGGKGITLGDLDWPAEIDEKFGTIHKVINAILGLYAAGIAFAFLTILLGIWWCIRDAGRCSKILTALCAFLMFLFLAIASAAVTAIAVKGVSIINKYADTLGIVAQRGNKLMAITWAATACAFIAWILASLGICCGGASRRERRAKRVV